MWFKEVVLSRVQKAIPKECPLHFDLLRERCTLPDKSEANRLFVLLLDASIVEASESKALRSLSMAAISASIDAFMETKSACEISPVSFADQR
jgi:hypothetical protein